jgi:hypothetical protein
MEELWQVFFEFKLAKKKGKQNILVDKDQIKTFMQEPVRCSVVGIGWSGWRKVGGSMPSRQCPSAYLMTGSCVQLCTAREACGIEGTATSRPASSDS